MDRAYSVLDVKQATEDEKYVYVEGMASTPSTDRMGDTVDPLGAKFQTPMPLLWQHNHTQPVGEMTLAAPNSKGIPFNARIPKIKEAGRLKERVDEAIHSLKYGLVKAVSIGFRVLEDGYEISDTGLDIKSWEWLELSLVTIPANSEAVISAVKSIDNEILSASGREDDAVEAPSAPAVADKPAPRRPIQLIPRGNRK